MTITVDDPFFAAIESEDIVLPSTGGRLWLPLRYRNLSTFAAQFATPTASARAALPSPLLVPREVAPGQVAVGVSAFDHRLSDLAPYRELGVFIPVAYRLDNGRDEVPGQYCAFLPVTTEEACVAGIDVWGFPKFVAQIALEEDAAGCRCRVHADGREIVTLEIGTVPIASLDERMEHPVFTVKKNEVLRTVVVDEGCRGQRADGEGVRVVVGDHPRADVLRRLGLGTTLGQSRGVDLKALLPRASQHFPLQLSPA